MGGDEFDDRDVAVFSRRFADYVMSNSAGGQGNGTWWTVKGPDGTDQVTGVEVLRFADRDFVLDDYDSFAGADISARPSYAVMGQVIQGRFNYSYDQDWIAFDFGRGVVDKTTTLKLTVTSADNQIYSKNLQIVNATGFALQFTDLSTNTQSSSFNLDWLSGTREYLIKGIQWGTNAEGGAFGGNQAFVVMSGGGGYDSNFTNPNSGAYSITVSRYRAGTAGDDVLTTDGGSAPLQADEVAGLGGNDQITGTDRAEVLDGGDGNDTIHGGGGADRIKGGAGVDALYGEAGDDVFVVAGETTVTDKFDGGTGTDTLLISNDVNLTGATFTSIEKLEGSGQRVTVAAGQLAGFTSASGVIFSGSNQDFQTLSGSYTLEGTAGDDVLKAGDGDNVIRPFAGNNTVIGGAGNDTVLWQSGEFGSSWDLQYRTSQMLSSQTVGNSYVIQGNFDGGAGSDTLQFTFNTDLYHYGLAGISGNTTQPSSPYTLDLTQATITSFETIKLVTASFTSGGATYSYGPSAIYLTASQLAQMTSLSGASFVVKGGGAVNLGAVTLTDGATLALSGDNAYTVTGTANGDLITTFGGADQITAGDGKDTISGGAGVDNIDAGAGDDLIIISGKSALLDVIAGGDGVDTLRITGGDVDLSGATLAGIEKIEANSASLALTQSQYDQYHANLSGAAGLILKMTAAGLTDVANLPTGFIGVRGSEGHDTLTGGTAADLLVGGAGDDSLTGGAGNDRLVGGAGTDTLLGGAGDDTLTDLPGSGGGVIDGGAGFDTFVADSGDPLIAGLSFVDVERITSSNGLIRIAPDQSFAGIELFGITRIELAQPVEFRLSQLPTTWTGSVVGSLGNDTLIGRAGDDTLDGGAGFNVVTYAGSEYDYIVTRLGDGSETIRAISGTTHEADGTDTLKNIQVIRFTDGATERVLDDASNLFASSNRQVALGEEVTGQTFAGDQDWYQVAGGQAGQKVFVTLSGDNGNTTLTLAGQVFSVYSGLPGFFGAPTSLYANNTYLGSSAHAVLDASGGLSLNVANNSLAVNSVSTYRFTVMGELTGSAAAETLNAGVNSGYVDALGGNDSVTGSVGADYLSGGLGSDTLVGGLGNDTLVGGDEFDDRDVAVFSGRFADYVITNSAGGQGNGAWWTVKGADGTDQVTGVEVLRFADRDYVLDDYDTFVGSDISTRPSYAVMGQVIQGRFNFNYDDDWIAFDFGRGVVDKTTTLKVTVTVRDYGTPYQPSLSIVNATGFALQFTDLGTNTQKSSFDLSYFNGTREYLVNGLQWGANAEGGIFGGNQAFLVMDGDYGSARNYTDPDQGAYSITVSRYRAGTAGDDVLSTDGATAQLQADEVVGLGGNDQITGTDRAEVLDGGDGNDTIHGGGGADRIKGGAGVDALYGEADDDVFVVAGETTVTDKFDGGTGTDQLLISNDVNLTGATFTSVEKIEGSGQRVTVSAGQLAGFTSANGVIFSGSNQDFQTLSGSYTLEGTAGDDVLKAGDGDNVMRPFAGNNVVIGGAGNDTVLWARGFGTTGELQYYTSSMLSAQVVGDSYFIQGNFDGGAGSDTLQFTLTESLYHSARDWWTNQQPSRTYTLDLTQATITSFETIKLVTASFTSGGATYSYGPSAIYLTAVQLAQLTSLSGASFVVKGGGAVNLGAVTLTDGATLALSGDSAYTVTGTSNGDLITSFGGADQITAGDGKDTISGGAGVDNIDVGAGDDLIIISGKSALLDVIAGGDGVDTLRITGGDVDLSGATLTGIDKIEANSASLALTQSQYDQYHANLSGAAGLILKMTSAGQTDVANLPTGFIGVRGSEGNDTLTGGAGADLLVGDAGDDLLLGNAGNDRLVGGAGSDTLRGGEGADAFSFDNVNSPIGLIDGGAGVDRLVLSDGQDISKLSFTGIELITGQGTVTMTAAQLASVEQINSVNVQIAGTSNTLSLGSVLVSPSVSVRLPAFDTTLLSLYGVLGSAQDDVLTGGAGTDLIYGGRGADRIDGGASADTLIGGSGADTLVGGAGDDLFRVEAAEFAAATGTVFSDVIDGGTGSDTLEINFNGSPWQTYQVNSAVVVSVERLVLNNLYFSTLALTAEFWNGLTSFVAEMGQTSPYYMPWLAITGTDTDINFNAVDLSSNIGKIDLNGAYHAIDASHVTLGLMAGISYDTALSYRRISVSSFDSILLSGGNDLLVVNSDSSFTADLGAGDDLIRVSNVRNLLASINGGSGNDTLDLSQNSLTDISAATLSSIENIRYGSATLILSQTQLDNFSFDGSGAKFLRDGNLVKGSAAADSFSGDGSGSFQGSGGNDNISYVDTAVFIGNYADYDFVRNGSTLTIQQARGSLVDGTDTLNAVLRAKFADTTVTLDDAPDNLWAPYVLTDLTHADYDKRVSARKDFGSDTDLFSATLAPSSPLAIAASSDKGSSWSIQFNDVATGQQLQFKSLVNGQINSQYYSWMSADQKWLPGVNTGNGFAAYQGGEVVYQFNLNSSEVQNYAFTLSYLDDYAGSVATQGQMDPLVGAVRGYIGDIADADWIRTNLIAGTKYEFNLKGAASGGGSLIDPKLRLLDGQGNAVASGFDLVANSVGGDDTLVFRPTTGGNYYLAVTDVAQLVKGSWTLTQASLDTVAGNDSTTERLEWSSAQQVAVTSEVNALSDHDWFKVWLDRGMTYSFRDLGVSGGGGSLADPQLSLRSVTGILLAQDDNSGGGSDVSLVYRPADSGWYFLDAGASGNAGKGTYTLSGSTLADDYGNSVQTNGVLQAGTAVHGLISYNGDSDWFKTGLTKGQMYVIDAVGDLSTAAQLDPLVDPLIIIHDAAGNQVFKADDFGGSLDARAYFTPAADGLYFIEVKSAFRYDTGAYQLSVGNAPADDFSNTVALALDTPTSAGNLVLGAATSAVIGVPGDHDMFRVNLEAGRVYQLSAEGLASHHGTLADPYLRVFDASGHLLDYANGGGSGADAMFYFSPTTSGAYYLEASANDDRVLGSYQVSAVQRDLPVDDVPNGLNTQVTLSAGGSFAGQLLTHNDQDWFGISLAAQQPYVFRVRASESGYGSLLDPVLEIRAGNGTLLQTVDNGVISHEPATSFTPNAAGTYYLVVKAADGQTDTGSYTLMTRGPDDHSDTMPGASLLARGAALDGNIQWSYGAFGVRAYDSIGIATDADEDWFKFSASAGEVLSVAATPTAGSSLSRALVEVVDGSGRLFAIGDGLETGNGAATASFKSGAAGTYYARVIDGAGATGSYTVQLSAGDAADEDAAGAVVLGFVSAGAVTQAQALAKIGLAGDIDEFVVDLQAGHQYRFETMAVRDGSQAPLASAAMTLSFTPSGGSPTAIDVAHAVAAPSLFDSAAYTAASSGRMSIAVNALDATQTGQYKLRVVDLGGSSQDDRPDLTSGYTDANNGVLAVNESAQGQIDSPGDSDLFAINLSRGQLYDFSVKGFGDGLGTLAQATLRLLDANGALVTVGSYSGDTGRADLAVSVFADGRYYVAVSATDAAGNLGTYQLDTRLRGAASAATDDISADTRSGVTVKPGSTALGKIDSVGDSDWISATLVAGKVYVADVLANGATSSGVVGGNLADATLRLLDASGALLMSDDDSGAGLDPRLVITAETSGTFYFDVGANGAATGTYTLRLRELYSGQADPMQSAQWYLPALGLDRLNGLITGAGITVGMVDDGIDTSHPDLQAQIDFALAYDAQFSTQDGNHKSVFDAHGTAVAGIIVAAQNNQTGIVGIAPDAQIVSTRVAWTYDQITNALGHQYRFDISNNSWGACSPFSDNFNSTALTFAYEALRKGVEDGRDGLGTVFVFSAGNSAGAGDNTNYHNFQNAREVITVAAANADGSVASFSTPGASVLVGAYGVDLLTTDRHQTGLGYNLSSGYTSFSGTSAAAPVVSGVAALMLEANPLLGYRDVQAILALSASHPDSLSWKTNAATNFNLGGMLFNDQFGFGLVDAYAAVQLADTWTSTDTAINEVVSSARAFGLQVAIPDGERAFTKTFHIDGAIKVEHVELGIDLRHTRLGDLVIELTSPSGTVSTLMNRPTVNAEQPFGLSGTDSGVPTHLVWDLSSVQFWGEQAVGDWTVTVHDVRAEETGVLASLSLRVYGARDDGNDTYVFTEEGFHSATAAVLQDETGNDTINASPMLHDMLIDLKTGLIAAEGMTERFASWTVIENAIGGAGSDRLDGNAAANILQGRDGNDTLEGGSGNDTLNGGGGSDTAVYSGAIAQYGISYDPNTHQVRVVDNLSSNGDEGVDLLTGIEHLIFSDGTMSLGATVGNHAPTANTSLFSSQVLVGKGMAISFDLPNNAFSDQDGTTAGSGDPAGLVVMASSASGGELPSWLSFDPVTGHFSGVPPEGQVGLIKVEIDALDAFGAATSGILTFQLGENQAPTLDAARELVINEDASLLNLGISVPVDPEGKSVTVTIDDLPTLGQVFRAGGSLLTIGAVLPAAELQELHYQTSLDANGNAGYLKFTAKDGDGVTAESSIHFFVSAVNDAPRFGANGQLTILYPTQRDVALDMVSPTDPESAITSVTVVELPALGGVSLNGAALILGQVLGNAQLSGLRFALSENVNGPIGSLGIQATDPQGLSTTWKLALQVQGEAYSNVGTANADAMYGSIGIDTLYGQGGNDMLAGNAGADRLFGGAGDDTLLGGSGNDILDGSSGNDWLDGGSGSDTMSGGPGNDHYLVDMGSDVVVEALSRGAGGTDLIETAVSYAAPANVENMLAQQGMAIDLAGNELGNQLSGNDRNNLLSGGAGADTLLGFAGDDTLDGGAGIDKMAGGAGNDLYRVDSRSDLILEYAGEGIDKVEASSTYTLPANVENLTLLEGGDYAGGGNSLANLIIGNNGNNVLSGGLGADTLDGGLGNDTYVLSDLLDTILDSGGLDTVRSSLSIVLQAGMERAELIGLGDNSALGNGADNSLIGNPGNNNLDGGAGVDTLTGGAGGDGFSIAYNGAGKAPDTITDFNSGEDLLIIDLASFGIDPVSIGINFSGSVSIDSLVRGVGARALDPNDYFLFDTAQQALYIDPDGSGPRAAWLAAYLPGAGAEKLVADDLYVFP